MFDEFAGKVDLVYIDPPFATGANFAYDVRVGEIDITKKPSAIEELAYRDTWSGGLETYLQWLYEYLIQLNDLLAPRANILVHLGVNIASYMRPMMSEIFGEINWTNEVIWQRHWAHNNTKQGAKHLGRLHDVIYFYRKSESSTFNMQYTPYSEEKIRQSYQYVEEGTNRRYGLSELTARKPGGDTRYEWRVKRPEGSEWEADITEEWETPQDGWEYKGIPPSVGRYWGYSRKNMIEFARSGRLVHTSSGRPMMKRYLDQMNGVSIQDIWADIKSVPSNEKLGYDTQKPEALLERIISLASNPGDLVLDCFSGSGTTATVAEKLGRRWIAADIGRYAIHTARKRLLDIPDCRPFEVQNLGRYERKHWQGANVGEGIGEYYEFILNLYQARSVDNFVHLRGEKAGRMVHVGATDAPVTNAELRAALEECVDNGFTALDVLGWEWEMGLNPAGRDELAAHYGIDTHLYNIPREVMDTRAVDAGDVHFFELSVAEVSARVDGREATLELTGFIPALDDYMREKTEGKIARWSDWIDYWSVDYEYDGETFVNQWQAYRTRREPRLALRSDPHRYAPGRHTAVAKVIDIFGNDTTCEIAVTVE